MPDPIEARSIAADALLGAITRLQDRGLDPDDCPGLLVALEHATVQMIAAIETGRDVRPYRARLDALYAELDAERPDDARVPAIEPPRRTLRGDW